MADGETSVDILSLDIIETKLIQLLVTFSSFGVAPGGARIAETSSLWDV